MLSIHFVVLAHVDAQILNKNYDRSYIVENEFVSISEKKLFNISSFGYFISQGSTESFTIFFPIKNDPLEKEKRKKTLDSISINDSAGISMSYEIIEENEGSIVIALSFPQNVVFGQNYSINLSYNAYGLLVKTVNIRDICIPAFSENYVFANEQYAEEVPTQVHIPKGLREINFVSVEHTMLDEPGRYIVSINSDKLIGTPAWIQVGTTQCYSFKLTQPFTSTNSLPFYINTPSIPIPREIISGPIIPKVYFESFEPYVSRTYLDQNQNLIAEFKLPANQSGEIKIKGFVEITQDPSFNSTSCGNISDINTTNALNASEYWEVESDEIKQVALELKQSDSIYEQTIKTYNYVIDKVDYSTVKRFGSNER